MMKHIKSITVYLRSLICTFLSCALFSPTTPEGMKVSFYCKMLLRKYLLQFLILKLMVPLTQTHKFTVTYRFTEMDFSYSWFKESNANLHMSSGKK